MHKPSQKPSSIKYSSINQPTPPKKMIRAIDMIQDPETPAPTFTFYVNYRSFLVSKSLVLNMDDYVAQPYIRPYDYVHIFNPTTRKYIQATVTFIESQADKKQFILTNIANKKYDPFEVACIIRHFDNSHFKHDAEMSLNDMTTFMYHINKDETSVSNETLNENIVSVDFNLSIAALEQAEAHYNECKETFKRCQNEFHVQQEMWRAHKQQEIHEQQQAFLEQQQTLQTQQQAFLDQQQKALQRQQQAQYVPYQQNTPRRAAQNSEATPQEFEHNQSKKKRSHIKLKNKKFRKLFEESIQEEPQERNITNNNNFIGDRMYGLTQLTATDTPSFKTSDDQYDENY